MNSTLTKAALASALASCLTGHAFGQAATTFNPILFGVMDVNLRAVRNGSAGTFKSESTDGLSSSRLGFRGTEDLGDGLKANFWLEAGVSPDTGTSNATKFFNRRSTVSLISPTLGEIRLGRDYTPLFTAYAIYDPFGTNGLGEIIGTGVPGGTGIISGLGSGTNTLTRSDNQVSYFLPTNLGGVYGQLAVAPSEGVAGNKYIGGRLGYGAGTFDVSLGYERTTVAAGDRFNQAHAGAFYDFGIVKISGQYLRSTYEAAAIGSRRQQVWQLGATVPAGRGQVKLDYIRGDMSGGAAGSGFNDADDAQQFSLGYLYNLSKRTALYTTASQLRNKGGSRLILATGKSGMLAGQNSTGVDLGIRHTF